MELAERNSIAELARPAVGSWDAIAGTVRGFRQVFPPMDEVVWISDVAASVKRLNARWTLRIDQADADFEAMSHAQDVPLVGSPRDADALRELMGRPLPKRRPLPKPLPLDE
jgi:hypothetical protein